MRVANYIVCLYSFTVHSKPTIKLLQSSKIITAIGPKWYELGIELLDDDQLTQLEIIKTNDSEVTRRCAAMLIYWLQSHSTATWQQLIGALKAPGVELNNVATMVEALFLGMYVCLYARMHVHTNVY